jgi:SAM-dependent methyltransferase
MLRRLVAEIPRRPPGRLLDVGCGAGHLLALARDAGWDVAGVDPSAEGCTRAAGRYGFRVTASSLEAAGMPDAMFDVVTLVNVLDQAPDPALLLAAARRTLRPGGLLVVRVPNGDFHRAAWRAIRLLPSPVSRRARSLVIFHSLCLGARTLRGLLERNGFRRVRVRNAPLSGSEWSVPGNARGRVALACMAAAARAGATLGTALTGGRIVWAPSLLAYAEREAA